MGGEEVVMLDILEDGYKVALEIGRMGLVLQDAGNGGIVENDLLWGMILRIEKI